MTINNWLTILAIVAGATVSLIVAHLHRKQMRQIELRRVDPSLPVTPPPSAITRFITNHGFLIFSIGVDITAVIYQLRKTGPVTRGEVFVIVFATAALAYTLAAEDARRSDARIYLTIDRVVDFLREIAKYAPSKKD
jgi:hypothetical protein